jgi:hypothetical protein
MINFHYFFNAMMIMLNRKCHLNVIGTARRVLPSMKQGSQILPGTTYQNGKNIPKDYQIGIQNDHKMYQIFSIQGLPKYNKIGLG